MSRIRCLRTDCQAAQDEADLMRGLNANLIEALGNILSLADENAKGIDGYEDIAAWARTALAKAKRAP